MGDWNGESSSKWGADLGPPVLITVEQAAAQLGIGRTRTYQLVLAGRIQSVKIRRRRLVVRARLEEFVQLLLSEQVGECATS
jgi:excisionase family DNA binding protein